MKKYIYGECKCTVAEGTRLVQKHLYQSKQYLDALKDSTTSSTSALLRKQFSELESAIKELTRLHETEHKEVMEEYAMKMLDLVKTRNINAKPKQRKRLRVLSVPMGYEKVLEEERRLKEEKEKKQKNKKVKIKK